MRYWPSVSAKFIDWLCRSFLDFPLNQWQQQLVISVICRTYSQLSLMSLCSPTAMHHDDLQDWMSKSGSSLLASTRGFQVKDHLGHCLCFFGESEDIMSQQTTRVPLIQTPARCCRYCLDVLSVLSRRCLSLHVPSEDCVVICSIHKVFG